MACDGDLFLNTCGCGLHYYSPFWVTSHFIFGCVEISRATQKNGGRPVSNGRQSEISISSRCAVDL